MGSDCITSDTKNGKADKTDLTNEIRKLIKFEKIIANELTNMIEFHRFSLKEKDDKEFSRRDEMQKFMKNMSDLSELSREGSLESREMILEISREMRQMNELSKTYRDEFVKINRKIDDLKK